jgi:Spy/CpxP family protein refolding chaperone
MKKLSFAVVLLALCAVAWAQAPENAPAERQGQQGQWQGRRGPGVGGTITAINGNAISIKTMDGNSAQVNVTDQTRFRKDRQDAKLADLKVGDMVMVRGEKGTDGAWQAEMVAVPPPGMGQGMMGNFREGLGKQFIAGEIKSITGTQIEILRPDGVTQTIAVDENTSFRKNQESVTLGDLKPGDRVFGRGELKNNVFVAAQLNQGQPRFMRSGDGAAPPPQQ